MSEKGMEGVSELEREGGREGLRWLSSVMSRDIYPVSRSSIFKLSSFILTSLFIYYLLF